MRIPFGSNKLTTVLTKAAGSGNLSIRLPPKIKLNFPKVGYKLHASPTTYLTLF